MTTFNFPRLEAVQAELKEIFDAAGPEVDLSRVPALKSMDAVARANYVRTLNDEAEELLKVATAAEKARGGGAGALAGADNGDDGVRWSPDGLIERPLRKGETVLERATKAAGRNPWPDDEEWRLGTLGALALGNSVKAESYLKHIKAPEFKTMSTSGAAVLVPLPIAGMLIDKMRAAAVTQRLGAQTVPMASNKLSIPRLLTDPTVGWLNENATVTATDATLDSVTFTARRLTGLALASQELVEDSDPVTVGQVLQESFGSALGTELDRVTLKGSGVAPEPSGIRNQSGVSVNATAAASTWAVLTDRVGVLLGQNVPMERIGVAVNVTSWATLFAQTAASGDWIQPPYGMGADRILATSTLAGPATGELYAGDYSEAMLGVRVALDFQILRERYADQGQVGFLPRVRADVQVKHGASFALRTALSS